VAAKTIRGKIFSGVGVARLVMPLDVMTMIRERTGFSNLKAGTLNVRLDQPHVHRADYTLAKEERTDGSQEDWRFELCRVSRNDIGVRALILRTTTNYHGNCVLELMAEHGLRDFFKLNEGDEVQVEVTDRRTDT